MPKRRTTHSNASDRHTTLYDVPLSPRMPVVYASPYERAIGRIVRATTARVPGSSAEEDLLGDMFYMMYKSQPEIKDKQIVPIEREVNRLLVQWASQMSNFDSARAATTGSIPAAVASATLMWEALLTDESLQEALRLQKEAEKLQDEADQQALLATNCAQRGNNEMASNSLKDSEASAKRAAEKIQQAADKLNKIMENPLGQGLMSSVVQHAGERGKEVTDFLRSWGQEAGNPGVSDVDSILKLVRENQGTLSEISKLVGRFKSLSAKTMERVRNSYVGPVAEANYTRDLMRLFPTERAKLSPDAPRVIRNLQVIRWADTGLLGWRQKSEGKRAGVFRAEVDGSGSMDGLPEIIAKAIALGIAMAVKSDHDMQRFYQLAIFGSESNDQIEIDSTASISQHLDWASRMHHGGTNFDKAMEDGLDGLERMRNAGHVGGDLLFITDGESYLSDEQHDRWIAFSRQTGARLIYVQIGKSSVNERLKELCSLYIQVDDNDLSKVADDLVVKITEQIAKPVG